MIGLKLSTIFKGKGRVRPRLDLAIVGIAILVAGVVIAGESKLKLEPGWVQAVPPVSNESAAYLKVLNLSDGALRLTGGKTEMAEMVMPMLTVKKTKNGQEMEGMKQVKELVIPAHGELELVPDGPHLMLMNLKQHPRPGSKVQLTLYFEPGGEKITTELPVALVKP